MEIDEKTLKELVNRVIELFQSESSRQNIIVPKKKLYVIFTEEFNEKYSTFFESLDKQSKYEAYAIVPEEIYTESLINTLKQFKFCKEVISRDKISLNNLDEYLTVFPIISKTIIAKTALCIGDTFETNWIFNSMEKGQKIILLQSGLEKFSGKEPVAYRKKILDYYRTLLEFDIEISEDIFQVSSKDFSIVNEKVTHTQTTHECTGKQIITEYEIEKLKEYNKIVLKPGDIITEMAKDKARSLNIEIVRKGL